MLEQRERLCVPFASFALILFVLRALCAAVVKITLPEQWRYLQFTGHLVERGAQFPRDRDALRPPLLGAAVPVLAG